MIIVDVKKNKITHHCDLCKITTTDELNIDHNSFVLSTNKWLVRVVQCEECDFVFHYKITLDTPNKKYYKIDTLTKKLIKKMSESNSLNDFDDIDFDEYPYKRLVSYMANRFIDNKGVAILYTKHKSKNIRNVCWNYLKTGELDGNV
jgi:hypothetical protein